MIGQSPSAKPSPTSPRVPAWLSLAAVSILLLVVPTAVYLFLYRASRIEDATIRNLRALDAAADRVNAVTTHLPTVVNSSSFGVSVAMLDELTERSTDAAKQEKDVHETGCSDFNRILRKDSSLTDLHELLRFHVPDRQPRLEFRYLLAVHLLSRNQNKETTMKILNQLYCLLKKHRKYSSPVETINVDVNPIPRVPLRSLPFRGHCGGISYRECDRRVRNWLKSEECSNSMQTKRFSDGRMTVTDCRSLCERNRDLHDALHAWASDAQAGGEAHSGGGAIPAASIPAAAVPIPVAAASIPAAVPIPAVRRTQAVESLIEVLDLFGVRSTVSLDELLTNATGHLSTFFDSHLIADSQGRILFESDASTPLTEADESHVATPAFSNHVDISALLRIPPARGAGRNETPPRSGRSADDDGAARSSSLELRRTESFVETIRIENIELRMFVHPFILNDINGGDSERNSTEDRASSTFYMVGIVDSEEFESDAIRLRLSLVINATLIVLVILTLCPLFWFWTAGDRLTLGPWALAAVCATPVVGVVLFVVLACGVVTNRIDERVLDDVMTNVADRIVRLFDWELHKEIVDLRGAVPYLRTARNPHDTDDPEKLNELEKKFYCDKSDRDLGYEPGKEYRESSFLIDEDGKQAACLSDGRLTRTPKLDLKFREYFKQPKEGVLWRPKRVVPTRDAPCSSPRATDKKSLIPCLVPGPIESWHRQYERGPRPGSILVTLRSTLFFHLLNLMGLVRPTAERLAEVSYFLERIDSVVRGDVQTVLAISACGDSRLPAGCDQGSVAAAGARLNSLDRAVPPSHVDFAVVDRQTGTTLFHSDDDFAMVTNFAEDVGGDPALWTLLRAGGSGTISLVYAGIPVRAHVRPLREGMPWALIVYRGHEIEDRLTSVTTALTAFFTLLPLFVLTILAGTVYVVYLCNHAWIASLPICLGRVMAAGSDSLSVRPGFRWATTGLTLAFLVWTSLLFFLTYPVIAVVSLPARWLLPILAVGSVIAMVSLLARWLRSREGVGRDGPSPLVDRSSCRVRAARRRVTDATRPAWFGKYWSCPCSSSFSGPRRPVCGSVITGRRWGPD